MKPLVISGCFRSGTAYIATVLSAAGYWCGHERVFNIHAKPALAEHDIESSGAAVPYLGQFPEAVVAHQVRHPLKVVASVMTRNSLERPSPSGAFALEHCPQIAYDTTPLLRALRYWVEWNRMVEPHAAIRWRLEAVDVEQVAAALLLSGREADETRLRAAFDLVPRTINEQPGGTFGLTWGDVPDCKLKRIAREMAWEYGYEGADEAGRARLGVGARLRGDA